MAVKCITANIPVLRPDAACAFYGGVLGLDVVMDHGWIMTFAAAPAMMAPQISIASQGGSGTPVPALSIEVDDLDAVLARVRDAGHLVEYGPQVEPWGVRRFYVRDPFGTLVNVLTHDVQESDRGESRVTGGGNGPWRAPPRRQDQPS